jgi:hypothetical protein
VTRPDTGSLVYVVCGVSEVGSALRRPGKAGGSSFSWPGGVSVDVRKLDECHVWRTPPAVELRGCDVSFGEIDVLLGGFVAVSAMITTEEEIR